MDTKPRILIIDDEPVVRNGCARILAQQGFYVETAADGEEGLRLAGEKPFDLAVVDLMMPGVDGMEVLRRLRSAHPDLSLVVITGYATVDKAVQAMKLGASDFLSKPFLPEQLTHAIRNTLDERGTLSTIPAGKPGPEELIDQNRIRAIIQSMEEGVLVTNRDGVIVLSNYALLRMIRFTYQPILDRPLFECIENQALLDMINGALEQKQGSSLDFESGRISECDLRARCAPVVKQGGDELLGAVIVFEDITSLKRVDRMKSEFVALVSHELKAPLATIQQMVYFLADGSMGPVNETQSGTLARVQARLEELLDLVKNLLDMSKLEAGTLRFDMAPIHVLPIVNKCLQDMDVAAKSKKIALSLTADENLPQVMGDSKGLETVIKNLVGNAIKYTLEGSVSVAVHHRMGQLILTVQDTGIGIPPEELPKIFEKFYRVKDGKAKWVTGTGLGLSITLNIVERHGGRIDVQSVYEQGTTFKVTLPALSF